MVVFEEDIKQGLDPLPVRSGCGMGPCGCTGKCKTVIGWIDRAKYLDFIKTYISKKDFIEQNYIKEVEQPMSERIYKIYLHNYGTKVQEYIFMRDLSQELKDVKLNPTEKSIEMVGHKKLCEIKDYLRKLGVQFRVKRVVNGREDWL